MGALALPRTVRDLVEEYDQKNAGIEDPKDVHYVQTKTPLLTIDWVEDAKRRGQTVAWCPGGRRRRSGTQSSITKRPPGARCRAALRKQATCSAWVSRLEIVLNTR